MQLTDAQFRVAVVENEKIVQVTQPVDFFTGSRVAKKTVELGLARFTVRLLENTKLLCDYVAIDLGGEHRVITCPNGCCLRVAEELSPPTPFGAKTPAAMPADSTIPSSTLKLLRLGSDGKVEVIHEAKVTTVAEAEAIIRDVSAKLNIATPGPMVSPVNPIPATASPPPPKSFAQHLASMMKTLCSSLHIPPFVLQTKDEENCHGK